MAGFWAGADLSPNDIELARRVASRRPDYIDLASSNPTHQELLFPPDVLRTGAEQYWSTRRYEPDPRGNMAAREAVTAYYARRSPPLALPPDQVFLTASTSEAYGLLFALLGEPGDNILAPDISYPLFEFLAAVHHLELRSFPMLEDRGWAIDEQALAEGMDERTRAVLIVSPHNPTGMVVRRPLTVLDQLRIPVICDEVFAPFGYRVAQVPPFGALHPELPIFHLNGISKMFALPDLKLGWIALNEPAYAEWGERLELLNDTFLGANGLSQYLLPTLFREGQAFVEQMVARVRANLDWAVERLQVLPNVRVQAPDGGYYLFPQILHEHDEEQLVLRLLDAGLNLHPGYFYGYERGVHLMLSALTEPRRFQTGIDRLIEELRPNDPTACD